MSKSQASEASTERITRSTARNPRRRPRQSENDGSLPVQAPKRRRRNEVKDDTFRPRDSTENVPPADSESVPDDAENIPVTSNMNGHLHPHDGSMRNGYGSQRDTTMPHRSKPKRLRNDGGTTLAHNSCYTVKMLPSTPKELRKEGVEYRGSLGGNGHALAVLHDKAIIWEYNAHLSATNTKTFDMPFASKAGGPLPFGALVSDRASGPDVGLVLISATTGKVVFYDSIEGAASLGLFQDRNAGVEGLVGSLFSGETVADLIFADHAGFVVVLSSGRIAQLTLRDGHGKPRVLSQFMRATDTSGGLLSSFGRLWSGGFKKDLTAVHTRSLEKRGDVQAVGLTEKAEVLIWDMDWEGRSEFKSSIEFWEMLTGELKDLQIPEMVGKVHNTTALDFAILQRPSSVVGTEIATIGTEQPLALLLLLRVGDHQSHTYALAEVVVHGDNVGVARIVQLTTYASGGDIRHQSKPRLVLPGKGHTAFVVFEDATLMVGTNEPESPEAQFHLQDESIVESQKELYEETIHLRSDGNLAIQNACEESLRGDSSHVVAFVKSAGLVRITANDVDNIPDALPNGTKISAKTRIEQAVFYGAFQPDNIIDFSRRTESHFKARDIESAALEVSQEIFRAETSFTNIISPSPQSIEPHLFAKAKALKALAAYVRRNYPVLSQGVMWKLLWDAERVAAGRELWVAFEEHVEMSKVNGKRKGTILDELCSWFEEKKDEYTTREELKDEQTVRKFFIAGLHRLENLLEFNLLLLESFKEPVSGADTFQKTPEKVMQFVYQANDVLLRSLETTFTFRAENCGDYGILPELIDDGILTDPAEFVDVPEFWTSTATLTSATASVATISRHFATEYFDPETMPDAAKTARDIALSNPRLVTLYCLQAREGISWRASRPSPKNQEHARELERKFVELRYDLCRQLATVGQAEAGMKVAEKYHDMNTLTDIVIGEEQYYGEELLRPDVGGQSKQVILDCQNQLKARISRYFDKYGKKWGDEFFDKLFSGVAIGDRLEQAQLRWKTALAAYLRSHESHAKLCWINDITVENDFAHAGEALAQAAEKQESHLWAKKVELSMSKLASLAANEASGFPLTNGAAPKNERLVNQRVLVDVQEKLAGHFHQEVITSIDHDGAVQLIITGVGQHTASYGALRKLLEYELGLLVDNTVLSIEQLIDVLTLIDLKVAPEENGNLHQGEFLNALIALEATASSTNMPAHRFDMLMQIIWKRLYIYDNWAELQLNKKNSDTERQETLRETTLWGALYEIISSGFMNESNRLVRFLAPSECLGAGCREEDMVYRFPDEELLRPILRDFALQDTQLQDYVNDRHLDQIVDECIRDTQLALQEEAQQDAEGGDGQEEHDLEMNGHAPAPNGHADGFVQDEDDAMEVEE